MRITLRDLGFFDGFPPFFTPKAKCSGCNKPFCEDELTHVIETGDKWCETCEAEIEECNRLVLDNETKNQNND